MRAHLNADHIANEIRMRRARWDHAFVIVEGDRDARFYKRFVFHANPGGHGVVVAHGRDHLLACLAELERDPAFADRVVAIADRDFWVLGEDRPPGLTGLLLTDGRDVESMVLRSPALDRLVQGYGSDDKLHALRQSGRDVAQVLLDAGYDIGLLRWHNEREGLRLDFNQLNIRKWAERKTLRMDRDVLVSQIAHRSRRSLDLEQVARALDALHQRATEHGYSRWEVCCGHDLMAFLKLGLRSLFGSCDQGAVEEEFAQTGLRAAMTGWQSAHPAIRLLKEMQQA